MAISVGELNVEIGAKLTDFERKMAKFQAQNKRNAKQTEQIWSKWGKQIGGIIAGTFAVGAITNVAKQIFNVTAEFQKMAAVLSNTLGSESEARAAMDQIKQFAAETPFSVRELTSAFVKLANQGFRPTMAEMRLMGDVASSTGKSFDQLTEAIIDAQTGEFERLKEFGIRAQKSGDQVTFSFKGVQTQVDFTSESIQQYILGLGELEGVQGANAKIAETLGGKFSNLNDAIDNLFNTIGEGNSGPMANMLDLASKLVKRLDTLAGVLGNDTVPWYKKLGYTISNTTLIGKAWSKVFGKVTGIQIDSASAIQGATEAIEDQTEALKQNAKEVKKSIAPQGRPREEIISLQPKGLPDLKQTVGGIIEPVKELNLQWGITQTMVENIANGFFNLFSAATKGAQSLIQALGDLIKQLIATVAKAAILAALMTAFGFGPGFGQLFGQALGFGMEFGGGKASGGPVNFGQAYLVGERGPELFMPGRSGSIMPNNKLGMMGATVAVGGRLLGQDILISNARSQQGLSRQTGR